jgi:hypothetical protein
MEDSTKVPQAELNYTVDWTEWLNGDTIAISKWVVPDDLTRVADSIDAGSQKAIVKIKGGTVRKTYTITNRITTAISAETDERSFQIQVVQRKEE